MNLKWLYWGGEGTEESSTEGSSSDYDAYSDSDTSIFNLMIQNVVQNIAI